MYRVPAVAELYGLISSNVTSLSLWLGNALASIKSQKFLTHALLASVPFFHRDNVKACRCIPGDGCWPSMESWDQFNETIHGNLIRTTLLAEVCHDPNYDAEKCAKVRAEWELVQTHIEHPQEFMAPYFQNQTCDPYTAREEPCTHGNYMPYVVNVTGVDDVVASLNFSQIHNVRLVIKNTGHDYLAKSTGKGALGLWTHNLKSISVLNYTSSNYVGPAIRMGAGVQGYDAYQAADAAGLRVVGGDCPTVGIAGGFSQGGGHSSLSSIYGMAADNVLEWEAVTANGEHIIASPTKHPDLYWALSGGGGGTFAIVLSMTAKAHTDGIVGGASLTFPNTDSEVYYKAVEAYHATLPTLTDLGGTSVFFSFPTFFTVHPITLPGKTKAEATAFLQPYLSYLHSLGITPTVEITSYPGFFEHYFHYNGPFPHGLISAAQVSAGRLLPRSLIEHNNSALTTLARTINALPSATFAFGGFSLGATHHAANTTPSHNAVHPAWRTALVSAFILAAWDFSAPLAANHAREQAMEDFVGPALERLTPGGGTYMNEANFAQRKWQREFYGGNYERLRRVKEVYDPRDVLYAVTAVGSEAWVADGEGRLCRTGE